MRPQALRFCARGAVTKPWSASADGVSDVARCQMPVMFLDIRVSAWPRFSATIVAAKTIEETAEAEPGPTLRGQLAVASPSFDPAAPRVALLDALGMNTTVVISPRRADHQQHPQQLAHSSIFKQ
jgi:hypothetical protein